MSDDEQEDCEGCLGFDGVPLTSPDCDACDLAPCPPHPDVVAPVVKEHCSPCGPKQVHSYSKTAVIQGANKGYMEFPVPVPVSTKNRLARDSYAQIAFPFAFPKLGEGEIVKIDNLKLAEGQFLFHPYYGSLYINQVVDECEGLYDLKNLGTTNQNETSQGQTVPCATRFALGILASETGLAVSGFGPCNSLTSDFHIPVSQSTSPAKVESFSGFALGGKVLLRNRHNPGLAYTYTLVNFSGIDTLILKNVGEGGTAGDVITAKDPEGTFSWCIESLVDIPLSEQAVSTNCISSLFGFAKDGGLQKIKGLIDNEALLYDTACAGFVRKVIPRTTKCAILTTPFQVVPLPNICTRAFSIISTTDDAVVLKALNDSVLSPNAEPIVYICNRPFSVNLAVSIVGSIRVLPLFNPTSTETFNTECSVCIPEDCCAQCAPQVFYPALTLFPVQPPSANFPPGYNNVVSWAIPKSLLTSATEYRFSVVKNSAGNANLLFRHPTVTTGVSAAYSENGTSTQVPNDADNLVFQQADYCHFNEACPVVMEYKEDIVLDMFNLPPGVIVTATYFTELVSYPCNQVGFAGAALSAARIIMVRKFSGPSNQSVIFNGPDQWLGIQLPGTVKTYEKTEGTKVREMTLFYPNCLRIKTRVLLSVLVTTIPAPSDFLYGNLTSTSILKGNRI